jgi:hypothetical protein
MFLIISILIGLSMSFTAIIITYMVSHRRFFRDAYILLEKYRLPSRVRDKGELRRIRKLSSMIRKAKRRILLLFFLHLSIFLLTYTTAIVLTGLIVPEDKQLVTIPVAIPLFSARSDSHYITHVLFLTFLAYLAPNYLIIRAAKPTH